MSVDVPPAVALQSLSDHELDLIDEYWRAANYLTVGQIYLRSNPLLRQPLSVDHIKPRLLGHWGTSPALNLLYVHANRLIQRRSIECLYLAGPGHGGPAVLANVYLEGTYSEVYPTITEDEQGMQRLFLQFSTPGGVPSHVSAPTPGSIHEGGELGYVLHHAFGAVMDHPQLLALAVVGDGEAETGPLAGSWNSIQFINPVHDGAVLPVLNLNGYKIANPTILGRFSDAQLVQLFTGYGYDVHIVAGNDPKQVHRQMAITLDRCCDLIHAIQQRARQRNTTTATPNKQASSGESKSNNSGGDDGATNAASIAPDSSLPAWPMIILRTPKGWTGPKQLNGVPIEGTFRAHQVPLANPQHDKQQLVMLEQWMQSYRPQELFDSNGRLRAELRALAPTGKLRMGSIPYANGGLLTKPLVIPDLSRYALTLTAPAQLQHTSTTQLGELMRDLYALNPTNFRLFCPDELASNKLNAVFSVQKRAWMHDVYAYDDNLSHSGRVIEVLSEHNCEGWLEGYTLTGRHGMFATYEAFAMIVASMVSQHAKWLEVCAELPWRAPIPSLNILLTSTCWRNDHNGFSHQGPGFMDTLLTKRGLVTRIYLPPDANCLLSVAKHCFQSTNYINLIIIDKQPQLQYLTLDQANDHCKAGASAWSWASTDHMLNQAPAIIMASAGDIPTLETLAAIDLLHTHLPHLPIRMINVVDLMTLNQPDVHPHGLSNERFVDLFTATTHVVFAYHGYPGAIHLLLHGRTDAQRFHVHGYNEEGTTTTPFDMVVVNRISRYHLVMQAIKRLKEQNYAFVERAGADELNRLCEQRLQEHHSYIREHLDDMPIIKDWKWTALTNPPQ